MTSIPFDAAGGLLRHRPFLYYFCARGLARFASQIAAVAVGWQVYVMTGSAFDLGMVGLAQFAPTALLTFIAGHAADRYDRKRVAQVCQTIDGLAAAYLALGTYSGWLTLPEIYAVVGVLGVCGAFDSPATAALLPGVTPEGMLQKGAALATGALQVASIGGPALGGVLYALSPTLAYAAPTAFWLSASLFNAAIKLDRAIEAKAPLSLSSLFDGVRFVRKNEAILGTISLDLFAVLFGGGTALLPIYARDILHTGPWGLGVLRGAPRGRRAAHGGASGAPCDQGPRRNADVSGGHHLRRRDGGLRAVALALAFDAHARDYRRRRYGQHGDPRIAGADRDAG